MGEGLRHSGGRRERAGRGGYDLPGVLDQKHVTLLGALRLAQEGVLDLNEDADWYLKSWKIPANGSWQPRVTVRQLLGHTAGLTSNWYPGYRRGEPTPRLLQTLEGVRPAITPPVRAVLLPAPASGTRAPTTRCSSN